MPRLFARPVSRLALIGALVAAFGLAGCGRKGALDPPPSAAATGEQTPAQQTGTPSFVQPIGGGTQSSGNALEYRNGNPMAPKGQKKHIPLDVLID